MDKKENEVLDEAITPDMNIDSSEFEWVGQDLDKSEQRSRPSTSFWKDAFGRLKKEKSAIVFFGILIFIIVCAIFVPIISPFTEGGQNLDWVNKGQMN